MDLILASKNRHKLDELSRILAPMGIRVLLESETGIDFPEVDETGETFAENAELKARSACSVSGLPAIADDSGLCIDGLDGAPGVYSARFAGEGHDDEANIDKVLTLLKDEPVGSSERNARFVSSVCCCFPNGDVLTARGECPGTIAFAPMGEGGFGYDPVFFVPGLKKTFAQLTAEEKNAISHRGKALEAFRVKLEEYLNK